MQRSKKTGHANRPKGPSVALGRATSLAGFAEFVERQGCNARDLLAAVKLPPSYLAETDLYFPQAKFIQLIELAARKTNNPYFGIEFGIHQGLRLFGPLAYLISSNNTLGNALRDMQRYMRLQTTGAVVQMRRHGRTAMITYQITEQTPFSTRHVHEHAIAAGLEIFRTILGRQWIPNDVLFQHGAVGKSSQYSRLLGLTPRFNTEFNALVFKSAELEMPLADADPALHAFVEREMQHMDREFSDDLMDHVDALIRYALPLGEVSLRSIAGMMATSPRTLQRRLSDLGTSFQTRIDAARRQAAEHYLRNSGLQVTQIAQLVGFTSHTNLTHAFHRWHGTSPRSWQQSLSQ